MGVQIGTPLLNSEAHCWLVTASRLNLNVGFTASRLCSLTTNSFLLTQLSSPRPHLRTHFALRFVYGVKV